MVSPADRGVIQCQGVAVGVEAGLAVAQDIVLVGFGDLHAAHPHGVGSNGRPGDDDGVLGDGVVGVLDDLAVAAELAAGGLLDHQRVADGDFRPFDGAGVSVGSDACCTILDFNCTAGIYAFVT